MIFLILLVLFVTIPFAEIALLLTIGQQWGVGPTLALVFGTGIVGAWLARQEGFRVLGKIQGALHEGRLPTDELIHAALTFAGGIVLLTPGLITDVIGLMFLFPPTRALFVPLVRNAIAKRTTVHMHMGGVPFVQGPLEEIEQDIKDVQIKTIDDGPPPSAP